MLPALAGCNRREERVRRAEALLPAALLVVAKREAPRAN